MKDSRKHLPGSLSEPGYKAPFLGSADAQLSGSLTLWLLSELDRGHFIRKVNVPVQVYRSHTFCLNHNLTDFTKRIWKRGVTVREGVAGHSREDSLIHIQVGVLGRISNIIYSIYTFTNVYTSN